MSDEKKKKVVNKEYTALTNLYPEEGVKVLAGEKVKLSAKLADHYKKSGAIE